MSLKSHTSVLLQGARFALASLALLQFSVLGPLTSPVQAQEMPAARTPIKHVIIIVGENRSFDHLFATYKPVDNLLSKHIVTEEGTPDVGFGASAQYSADDTHADKFETSPQDKSLYGTLPPPLVGGPTKAPISTIREAMASENGLDPAYYVYLTTGGTADQRIQNVMELLPGPFQLTSDTFPYDSYAASPVHRFYQMWQELDCNVLYATFENPGGCNADLFPWVEVTVGAGTNGLKQPAGFNNLSTGEGSTSMGFYNMSQGDAPYTKFLADNYAISDNYHQPAKGGTGLDSLYLGFADAIWFSDADFNPAVPPHNVKVWTDQPKDAGVVDEIENPNPQAGTNNWYTEDGYGRGGFGSPVFGGRILHQLLGFGCTGSFRDSGLSKFASVPGRSEVRSGPLPPAEQLQPGVFWRRDERVHGPQRQQHAVHDSSGKPAEHRGCTVGEGRFLEVLRRPV